MKKITFISLAAMAILSSCAKEMTEAPVNMVPVSISTSATKTTLGEGNAVLWSEGDQISIYASDENTYTFTVSAGSGTSTATFQGSLPESVTPLYAIYPKVNKATSTSINNYFVSSDSKTVFKAISGLIMPAIQEPVLNNPVINPSFGTISEESGNYSVAMKNTGALLKITIPANMTDITSVTLSSLSGATMSGDYAVDIDNGKDTLAISQTWDQQVTLQNSSASAITPGTYYLCALPSVNGNTTSAKISTRTTYSNAMLKLTNSSGKVSYRKISGPSLLKRNTIYPIALSDTAFVWCTPDTVILNYATDLPKDFPTTSATRTKDNVTVSVGTHDFILYSDENCTSPQGWYGWYASSGTLTAYFGKGDAKDTKVSDKAYIKFPDDFDGNKLTEIVLSTQSQNKTVTVVSEFWGTTGRVISNVSTRETKSTDKTKGIVRVYINKESEGTGYFLKLSHSGNFNLSDKLTLIYTKPDN